MGAGTEPPQTEDFKDAIEAFFSAQHQDGSKTITGEETLSIRNETIGVGQFSRIRLVEAKQLPKYLENAGLMAPEDCGSNSVSIAPEVSTGIFALKVMKKSEVVRLKQAEHVKSEAGILQTVKHPFIVSLFYRYQDEKNLCLVEEFVQCGNLGTHIKLNKCLPNETARFYAAQIVMAIQYLHSEHIIHRDLNPDNVMLDRGYYVKLVDFGLAKGLNLDEPTARTWTLCGIAEYTAPEVILSKGHSKEVDWWALGVVIYEMLAGYPPWFDQNPHKVYEQIIMQPPPEPQHFDPHGKELIKKLLTKERHKRIGSSKNGAEDIKKHKWYRGLNWAALYNKQMVPPLEGVAPPAIQSPTDISNFDPYPTSSEETGPLLDPERDAQLFGTFASVSGPQSGRTR